MTVSELKQLIDEFLSDDNNNADAEVMFVLSSNHLIGDFPINSYGYLDDHIQLSYIDYKND